MTLIKTLQEEARRKHPTDDFHGHALIDHDALDALILHTATTLINTAVALGEEKPYRTFEFTDDGFQMLPPTVSEPKFSVKDLTLEEATKLVADGEGAFIPPTASEPAPSTEGWESEFDRLDDFASTKEEFDGVYLSRAEIKNLIRTLLTQERERTIKQVTALAKEWRDKGFEMDTFIDRLGTMKFDDILSALKDR